MRELVARVQAALRRSRIAPVVRAGRRDRGPRAGHRPRPAAGLPGGRGRATREDAGLTPTEFRLLLTLAQQAGRAMSRDELQQRVWHVPYRPRDRSVDVCVRKLREKLDRRSTHTYLQTHYGVGYRFDAVPQRADASPAPGAPLLRPAARGRAQRRRGGDAVRRALRPLSRGGGPPGPHRGRRGSRRRAHRRPVAGPARDVRHPARPRGPARPGRRGRRRVRPHRGGRDPPRSLPGQDRAGRLARPGAHPAAGLRAPLRRHRPPPRPAQLPHRARGRVRPRGGGRPRAPRRPRTALRRRCGAARHRPRQGPARLPRAGGECHQGGRARARGNRRDDRARQCGRRPAGPPAPRAAAAGPWLPPPAGSPPLPGRRGPRRCA